jgi:hypothetical protein
MKDFKTSLYKMWLALGLVQLALLSGCSGATAGDSLLSQGSGDPTSSSSHSESSMPPTQATQPLRLSRAFFEKSLVGSVTVGSDKTESDVTWTELPPTSPAPTGPVIADLRDHKGCASYDSVGNVSLCFNIMPDVSSVGVNAKDVSVTGLCGGKFLNSKFVDGSYVDGVLTVTFSGTCNGQSQLARLTLRQI